MRLHLNNFYKHRGSLVPINHKAKNDQRNSVQNKSASTSTSGFFSEKNTINFKGNLGQKILSSNKFFDFAKMSKSQAMVEAFSALILAGVLRPATIMASSKSKNDKDTQYAAVHGIASAAIGYAFTVAITSPIKKGGEKLLKKLKNDPNFMKGSYLKAGKNASKETIEKAAKYADNFKLITEYAPQIVLVPIRAAMTIALIPPIMKFLFPNHKKTKEAEKKAQEKNLDNAPKNPIQNVQTNQIKVKEQANANK